MNIQQEWSEYESDYNNDNLLHRETSEEFAFYQAVGSGDIETVRRNCEQNRFNDTNGVGKLSHDPVTNLKYHFVITTALITRACVASGMEMEQAYRLSDFYILKLDYIHSIKNITNLHDNMVLDFTGKMKLIQNKNTSKPVALCLEYIYSHIKERITIRDLADCTGFSVSYLSHIFKEELGISVSEYIREKKIEKAQNLLKFCDYSLVEIANYLSFSSQSHFIQVFQNHIGMTPGKYRSLYYRSNWDK